MNSNENSTALGIMNGSANNGLAGASTSGYMQQVGGNPPRCECHECTQIRWKLSMQGQLQGVSVRS